MNIVRPGMLATTFPNTAKHIMSLAFKAQQAEREAVQNAEFQRDRVKYQEQSDAAMQELADYLGVGDWRRL